MAIQWIKFLAASMVAFALAALVAYAVEWHLLPLARRYAASPARAHRRGSDDPVDPSEGVVRCPTCGTENDLGYRFCRVCVAELPGAVHASQPGSPLLGRVSR